MKNVSQILLIAFSLFCFLCVISSPAFSTTYGVVFSSVNKNSTESLTFLEHCSNGATINIVTLNNIPNIFILDNVSIESKKNIQNCLQKSATMYPEKIYKLEDIDYYSQLNDPEIHSQWHLHNPRGVDAEILKGWSYLLSRYGATSPGTPEGDVSVAVIDTGISLSHKDLVNVIYRNSNEISDNNLDDDHNGFVDDVSGWNFVNNTPLPEDDHGHGTHVSGIIAAEQGNNFGVAGIYKQAMIIPIRAFDSSGEASSATLVKSIDYAIGMKARIINASWGQYEEDPLLEAAIKKAAERNILIVAAAGNEGTNIDQKPHWPSSYSFQEIISVGAIEKDGSPAGYSNYGANSVDVFSPGSNIYSTYLENQFSSKSGTSMATPVISGIAAAMLGFEPDLPPIKLKLRILDSARLPNRMFPKLQGKCLTGGVPSLLAALGGNSDETYDNDPPSAPKNLTTQSDGHFEAMLSWLPSNDNISVDHYLIRRDLSPYVEASCCTYKDRSTEGGKTYTYSVMAVDWAGHQSTPGTSQITTPQFGEAQHWSAFPVHAESPHPYPASSSLVFEIKVPDGYAADKIRVHFTKFETEEWFDKVFIYDQNGVNIATYMGELEEFVSSEIPGNYAKIVLTTDKRNNRYGFVIDRLEAFLQ